MSTVEHARSRDHSATQSVLCSIESAGGPYMHI